MKSPEEREYFKFRYLSVDDSVLFVLENLVLLLGLALLCGAVLAAVHQALIELMGGGVSLLGRLVEATLLSLWPLGAAARVAKRIGNGEQLTAGDVLSLGNIFPLAIAVFALFAMSLVGALVVNKIGVWIWPDSVSPLWTHLSQAPTVSGGMAVYPLLVLGGMLVATGFSLAPLVAVHEGGGLAQVLSRSRYLSRDIKMAMLFLIGFQFIAVSFTFVVTALVPDGAIFSNRLLEAVIISLLAAVTGFCWNNVYDQAMALEPVREKSKGKEIKRFIIR